MSNWVEQALSEYKSPKVLESVNSTAAAAVKSLGFPTSKLEEWKYTNVSPIGTGKFKISPPSKVPSSALEALVSTEIFPNRVVFVDGAFAPEHSLVENLPSGLRVGSIVEALNAAGEDARVIKRYLGTTLDLSSDHFGALNGAFFKDGCFIHLSKNKEVTKPLLVLHISTAKIEEQSSYARVLIVAEDGSSLPVLERYVSLGNANTFSSAVTECILGANASVRHLRLQEESESHSHISLVRGVLNRDSRFYTWNIPFGGKLVRNNVSVTLNGTNSHAELLGLSVLGNSQHVDNHTIIEHAKENCTSNEKYKGIYSGNSAGVFCGTIIVQREAQKTNAYQSNQSVLLSDRASVDTKPQLKIWADDVKCTHGATIGQLDEDALFYLRSRGIPKLEAKRMLVHAFASEVLSSIEMPEIRRFLEDLLSSKLESI